MTSAHGVMMFESVDVNIVVRIMMFILGKPYNNVSVFSLGITILLYVCIRSQVDFTYCNLYVRDHYKAEGFRYTRTWGQTTKWTSWLPASRVLRIEHRNTLITT